MKRKIPFMNLAIEDDSSRQELLSAVDTVFRHGRFIEGPEVRELESKVATYCNRKYAVGVNSGTDALFLGLKSLAIGLGDEVITTALSWIATANAITLTGATPVFADIRDDLNIDPVSVRSLITSRTKAIVPVHFTGKVCQISELLQIAEEHGLLIIEDAAQAFGASYYGQKAGSFGIVGCFSMNPMKVFAACGEAGMVVTDREDIYRKLIALRHNGTINREMCVEPGLNARIDTLQAAMLLKRFPHVESTILKRHETAAVYYERLNELVSTPREMDGEWDTYYTYTICAAHRDELKSYLELNGVETKIQHPYLMPEHIAYQNMTSGELKNAKRLSKEILCLPIHEKLLPADIEYVASCIHEFYKKTSMNSGRFEAILDIKS